jgi:sulfite reductase (ferredoxin)
MGEKFMSVEEIKQNSFGLRGTLPIEVIDPSPQFSDEGKQLLKFHGIYQQTNRDVRGHHNKQYRFGPQQAARRQADGRAIPRA